MKKCILLLFILLLVFTQGCSHISTSDRHNTLFDSLTNGANEKKTRFPEKINPDETSIAKNKIYAISTFYKSKTKPETLHNSIKEIFWASMFFWPELFVDLATGQGYENEPKEKKFNFNQ